MKVIQQSLNTQQTPPPVILKPIVWVAWGQIKETHPVQTRLDFNKI